MSLISPTTGSEIPHARNLQSPCVSAWSRNLARFCIGTLLALGAGSAVAAEGDTIFESAGTLVLDLTSVPRWTYDGSSRAIAVNSDCSLGSGSLSSDWIVISGVGGQPGIRDSGTQRYLGLQGVGNNCGVIRAGQGVTFTLGSELTDKIFTQVNLGLFMEKNAILQATVKNGGDLVAMFKVYSGTSENLAGDGAHKCSAGQANSGPNSANTNCELSFTASGNSLELSVVSEGGGSASGEVRIGGAGSTSTFAIGKPLFTSMGELSCGAPTGVVAFVDTDSDQPIPGSVQCRRLDNLVQPPGTACTEVDYQLRADRGASGDRLVSLLYGPDPTVTVDQLAFVCEAWWPEEEAVFIANVESSPPVLDVPPTLQRWGSSNLPTQGVPLAFCENVTPVFEGTNYNGTCNFEAAGNVGHCGLPDLQSVTVPPTMADQVPELVGKQLGCLLDERIRLFERENLAGELERFVKQYQFWYIQGDYTALRGR